MAQLDPAVHAFLAAMKVPCVISTLRTDGHPITSATWYGFLEGDLVVATPAERNKARNIARDPRISFLVDTKEMPYRGVAIEGIAEICEDPGGAIISAIVHRYLEPAAAGAMLSRLGNGGRIIIRIRPQRVRPWAIDPATPPAGATGATGATGAAEQTDKGSEVR
jgi:PPOX class probable F420-dependent enzyme